MKRTPCKICGGESGKRNVCVSCKETYKWDREKEHEKALKKKHGN